jgi:hypothetical protein
VWSSCISSLNGKLKQEERYMIKERWQELKDAAAHAQHNGGRVLVNWDELNELLAAMEPALEAVPVASVAPEAAPVEPVPETAPAPAEPSPTSDAAPADDEQPEPEKPPSVN